MARVIWTLPALRDVERLHAFLREQSGDAARRAARSIRQGVKVLRAHPQVGRPVEDLPPEFREWVVPFGGSAYVTLYHYDGETVAILAVRHGREAGY